jgi:hypothetical protein
MAQPRMAPTTCSQCKAWYSSERELCDHMRTVHRWFDSQQSVPPSSVQSDRANQGYAGSFLTEQQENEMDQSYGRTPAEQQAEYTRPDEDN